jgi:hypothetical protein
LPRLIAGLFYALACHPLACHPLACHPLACHPLACHPLACHPLACHPLACHPLACHLLARKTCQRVPRGHWPNVFGPRRVMHWPRLVGRLGWPAVHDARPAMH